MTNAQERPSPESDQVQLDSLNCEIAEPTDVVDDYTVRPMRESLRRRLQPPLSRSPQGVPKDNPSA
jgi:hypothetical protein